MSRRYAVALVCCLLAMMVLSGVARATHKPSVVLGRKMAHRRGWDGYEWRSLYLLWDRESSWSPWARNPSSGACGIAQALPCPYPLGARFARVQIRWGLRYIARRYSRPSVAWAHSEALGWY